MGEHGQLELMRPLTRETRINGYWKFRIHCGPFIWQVPSVIPVANAGCPSTFRKRQLNKSIPVMAWVSKRQQFCCQIRDPASFKMQEHIRSVRPRGPVQMRYHSRSAVSFVRRGTTYFATEQRDTQPGAHTLKPAVTKLL